MEVNATQLLKAVITLIRMLTLGFIGITTAFVLIPVFDTSITAAFTLAGGATVLAAYISMTPSRFQIPLTIGYLAISTGILVSSTICLMQKYGRVIVIEAHRHPISASNIASIIAVAIIFAITSIVIQRVVGLDFIWGKSKLKQSMGLDSIDTKRH